MKTTLKNTLHKASHAARATLLMLIAAAMIFPIVKPAFAAKGDDVTYSDKTNVLNKIDPQGHNSRLNLAVGSSYYNMPNNTKQTIIDQAAKDGWLTNVQQNTSSNSAQDWHWVRYTEIVPRGDTPRAKLPQDNNHRLYLGNGQYEYPKDRTVKRFVPDDGTFIPPVQADKVGDFVRNFGLEINGLHSNFQASYTFGNVPTFDYSKGSNGSDKQIIVRDDNLNQKWLPYNGYGNITLFSSNRGPDKDATTHSGQFNWYWCINPNAADPREGYFYVKEPTRFSGQTNFQDLPGMAYILTILNKISPLGQGASPDFNTLYDKLIKYYNDNIVNTRNDSENFEYDNALKNGEIRKVFSHLATLDGQKNVVDGMKIRVQQDHAAMGKKLKQAFSYESHRNRQFTNLGVAIEFFLTHHSQGLPLDDIDKLLQVRQVGLGRQGNSFRYEDVVTMHALTRLLFAIEFAAKEKGLVQQYDPTAPTGGFSAKLANVNKTSDMYSATINLQRPMGDKLLVAVSKGVKFTEQSQLTLVTPGKQSVFDNFYGSSSKSGSEVYYQVPNTLNELHVSYNKTDAGLSNIDAKPHPSVRFMDKQTRSVIGEVFTSADSYEYNKESGHWLVKEFANFNYGMSNDQAVVSVTPRTTMVPQALALDLVDDVPTPTLKTTVEASGHQSNSTTPATVSDDERMVQDGVSLTDHVAYDNMIPSASYTLKGELFKVTPESNGGSTYTADSTPVATKEMMVTVDTKGSGTWDLAFNKIKDLEPSARYVVYETATPTESMHDGKQVKEVEHKNPNDVSQTFVTAKHVPVPEVKTVVTAGSHMASSTSSASLPGEEAESYDGVNVKDTIIYKNLKGGAQYNVEGTLYEVQNASSSPSVQETIPLATANGMFTADPRGSAFQRDAVTFNHVKNLKPGKSYVVYEKLTLVSPGPDDVWGTSSKPIEHKNPADKSQTVVVQELVPPKPEKPKVGMLHTTVNVANHMGSSNTPATVKVEEAAKALTVTDTISYTDLLPNKMYSVTGQLYKRTKNGSSYIIGSKVAEQTQTFQTNMSGTSGSSDTWKLSLGNVKLEPGKEYVVYETADLTSPQKSDVPSQTHVEHKNANDNNQAIVVTTVPHNHAASLKTTVSVDNQQASDNKELTLSVDSDSVTKDVVDTVSYTGLIPGYMYTLTSTLNEVGFNDGTSMVGASESKTFTPTSADGVEKVTFSARQLQVGKKYVAFEKLVSKAKIQSDEHGTVGVQTLTHENANDKAQTVVVKRNPMLQTTVEVDGRRSNDSPASITASQAAQGMNVTDHVHYIGFTTNEHYMLKGELYKVINSGGSKTVDTSPVATASQEVTASSDTGDWSLTFNAQDLKGKLQAGESYVVFETATKIVSGGTSPGSPSSTSPEAPVEHHNPNDTSQTFVVGPQGKLATSVAANGQKLSDSNPALVSESARTAKSGVSVVDTVSYMNLKPSSAYTLTAKLYKVVKNGTSGWQVSGNAVATKTLSNQMTESSGNGSWTVTFDNQKQLTAHTRYVVFETATLSQTDATHKYDMTVAHNDPSDINQTFVTDYSTPTLRTTVRVGGMSASSGDSSASGEGVGAMPSEGDAGDGMRESTDQTAVTVTAKDALSATGVHVVDHVTYTNLVGQYELTGKLMRVVNGQTQGEAVATMTKRFSVDSSGNGSVDVDFGMVKGLLPDAKYVVFETAVPVGDSPQIPQGGRDESGFPKRPSVSHENPGDTAQTVVIMPKLPVIATTVKADDRAAGSLPTPVNDVKRLLGVHLVDTVRYANVPADSYKLTGELYKVHMADSGSSESSGHWVIQGSAVKTVETTVKSAGMDAEWTVDFGTVKNLDFSARYVVFETLRSADGKHVIAEHRDANDTHQSVQVGSHPMVRTVVRAAGVESSSDNPVRVPGDSLLNTDGVTVTDTIHYSNLADRMYRVEAKLYRVVQNTGAESATASAATKWRVDGEPIAVKTLEHQHGSAQEGMWTVTFDPVKKLQVGSRYVVFEMITDESADESGLLPTVVRHEDPDDMAQSFETSYFTPVLRTTVTAGKSQATLREPAQVSDDDRVNGVSVVDHIDYKYLRGNTQYKVTGELVKVVPSSGVESGAGSQPGAQSGAFERSGEAVATAEKTLTADPSGNGTWSLDFGAVKGLDPSARYIVFETAVPVTPTSGGSGDSGSPTEPAPSQPSPGTPTTPNPEQPAPKAPKNDSPMPPAVRVEHKNPNDTPQTVVTVPEVQGVIATTVQAGDVSAVAASEDSSAHAKPAFVPSAAGVAGVRVVDHVRYNHLLPNVDYVLSGALYKVTQNNGKLQVDESKPVVQKSATVSADGRKGTWSLDFGMLKLEPAARYVVFETAVPQLSDSSKRTHFTVEHKNPSDTAQTVVVRHKTGNPARIGTTVHVGSGSAPNMTSDTVSDTVSGTENQAAVVTAEKASAGVHVTDTVRYEGLLPNNAYTLTSKLMKIAQSSTEGDGSTTSAEPVAVKTVTKSFTPSTSNGEVMADFGVLQLEPNTRYVAFEMVESQQAIVDVHQNGVLTKHVLHHENVSDKAQTVVVLPKGKLVTVVEVDGVKAGDHGVEVSVEQAHNREGVHVVDHVHYENLLGSYKLTGALMHIVDGKAQGDPVAVKTVDVTAESSNSGEWIVDFGMVKGLVLGEKYVVFETAVPTTPNPDAPKPDVPNPDKPNPGEPTNPPAPSVPTEPGNPTAPGTPSKPVQPGMPDKPTPETPENPSVPDKPVGMVEHKNPHDEHQTVIVKTPPPVLTTTVEADGVTANSDKAVGITARQAQRGVRIVDTVVYVGLKGQYVLTGDLMHIVDGKVQGKPVSSRSITLDVTSYEQGKAKVDFGVLTSLVPGEKYVVFETAVPVEPSQPVPPSPESPNPDVPNPDKPVNPGEPDKPAVPTVPLVPDSSRPTVEHHNPDNPSQTVVVHRVPPVPTVPKHPRLSKTGAAISAIVYAGLVMLCAAGAIGLYKYNSMNYCQGKHCSARRGGGKRGGKK